MNGLATEKCCPPSRSEVNRKQIEGRAADEELADLAKALAHPARVRILKLLLEKQNCICGEIVDELDLAQSTVSQHLKILKEVGLIRGDIDGPRTCYCADTEVLRRFKILMAAL